MECSPTARLLFIGLWNFCDDGGNHPASTKTLKAEVFPGDDISASAVQQLVAELVAQGLLIEYQSAGKAYWHVTGWHHQKIEKPTIKFPAPPGNPQPVADQSPNARRVVGESSPPEGKGEDIERRSTTTSPAGDLSQCPADRIVDAYHRHMPDNPRCKVLNPARRGAIKARWNEAAKLTCKPFGYSTTADGVVAWEQFFGICAKSEFLTGRATPQPGKPPFFADIDFLMSPSGFAKCIENKYHREAA